MTSYPPFAWYIHSMHLNYEMIKMHTIASNPGSLEALEFCKSFLDFFHAFLISDSRLKFLSHFPFLRLCRYHTSCDPDSL